MSPHVPHVMPEAAACPTCTGGVRELCCGDRATTNQACSPAYRLRVRRPTPSSKTLVHPLMSYDPSVHVRLSNRASLWPCVKAFLPFPYMPKHVCFGSPAGLGFRV